MTSRIKNLLTQEKLILMVTLLIITAVYLIYALIINKNLFTLTNFPYYNLLADALFDFRLDLKPISWNYDLSLFQNKWYLYWGPAPVIFVFPFYFIFGIRASDVLYTLIAGVLNFYIIYLLINQVDRYFKLKLKVFYKVFFLINFAVVSQNFYLSFNGRIWHTNQVISIFFLLLFLVFYFKYLNTKSVRNLILSILLFNIAWLSRYTFIFYGMLFIYPMIIYLKQKDFVHFKKLLFTLIFLTTIFVSLFMSYNYLRFNNPFETGIKYQIANSRYESLLREGKNFSPSNFTHNFKYYFLNPLIPSLKSPFINFDFEGNSVFSVYPTFLLIFYVFRAKIFRERKNKLFLLISLLVTFTITSLMLMFLGTGWMQFGNRYFFDAVPMLLLSILLIIREIPGIVLIFLLLYGLIINLLGTLLFYNVFK